MWLESMVQSTGKQTVPLMLFSCLQNCMIHKYNSSLLLCVHKCIIIIHTGTLMTGWLAHQFEVEPVHAWTFALVRGSKSRKDSWRSLLGLRPFTFSRSSGSLSRKWGLLPNIGTTESWVGPRKNSPSGFQEPHPDLWMHFQMLSWQTQSNKLWFPLKL